MNGFEYFIQVNCYLALFYAFYLILLRNETFFNLNRAFLVSSALLSFFIPVLQSDWIRALFITQQIAQGKEAVTVIWLAPVLIDQQPDSWSVRDLILTIYLLVTLILLVRFIVKLVSTVSFQEDKKTTAFSFFNRISVSSKLPGYNVIYKHEQTHARHLHSADILFFEALSIINWFNPVIYLYKRSIKHIHEFIADAEACRTETKANYALLLLSNTLGVQPVHLTNNFFNQSLLKKRIMMLDKVKSKKAALLKYGLSAPLFAVMLIFSSATINNKTVQAVRVSNLAHSSGLSYTTAKQYLPADITGKARPAKTDTLPSHSEITVVGYPVGQNLPSFPGGTAEFYKFISKNYTLPEEVKKNHVSGKVMASFTVEKDGRLSDIKILHDLGFGTGSEAVRVLKESPKWIPGMKDGQPIRTTYTVPILLNTDGTQSGISFFIRSATTSAASKDGHKGPIYLVDGQAQATEQLKEVDPNAIKFVRVIKGKEAIDQYGEKAQNGLVELYVKTVPPEKSVEVAERVVVGHPVKDSSRIVINGQASKPLIVLDNVQQDPAFNVGSISANDINTISVLKGKEALDKYGNEAKDGVIIITTKKSKPVEGVIIH